MGTPQTGQTGYDYNYEVMQWYAKNWYGVYTVETAPYKCTVYNPPCSKGCNALDCVYWSPNPASANIGKTYLNPVAVQICIGIFVPLFVIANIRLFFKPNKERNKSVIFRLWYILSSMTSLVGIIIAGNIAYNIKNGPNATDYYNNALKIIGPVTPGLSFLRVPSIRWDFGKLIGDVFILSIIAFMESYSVAHRFATRRNELHILNASQELFANSCANFMAAISSSYPISGSYSRSSLNEASGARTPLSKIVTLLTIVLTLAVLTTSFQYIPYAVLSSIVWVSIWSLINFKDFWEAWKHSKKDFFTMFVTFIIVFIFNTETGLATGLVCSALVFLVDSYVSQTIQPEVTDRKNNVKYFQFHSDLTFLQTPLISDKYETLIQLKQPEPSSKAWNIKFQYQLANYLDQRLGKLVAQVDFLPSAIVFDMNEVKIVDLTGVLVLKDATNNSRTKGVKVVFINLLPSVAAALKKIGIKNDASNDIVNLDEYLALSKGLLTLPSDAEESKASDETESLLTINDRLKRDGNV